MTSSRPQTAILATLPEPVQARLRAIGSAHCTEFGTCRHYQIAFDENIDFLDDLIARGANHDIIRHLLAEVGVTRRDGSPLPLGTVSSALSRAHERAARSGSAAPAAPGRPVQDIAGARSTTQASAGRRKGVQETASGGTPLPAAAAISDTAQAADAGNDTRPPRRTASLLNQLRSRT